MYIQFYIDNKERSYSIRNKEKLYFSNELQNLFSSLYNLLVLASSTTTVESFPTFEDQSYIKKCILSKKIVKIYSFNFNHIMKYVRDHHNDSYHDFRELLDIQDEGLHSPDFYPYLTFGFIFAINKRVSYIEIENYWDIDDFNGKNIDSCDSNELLNDYNTFITYEEYMEGLEEESKENKHVRLSLEKYRLSLLLERNK